MHNRIHVVLLKYSIRILSLTPGSLLDFGSPRSVWQLSVSFPFLLCPFFPSFFQRALCHLLLAHALFVAYPLLLFQHMVLDLRFKNFLPSPYARAPLLTLPSLLACDLVQLRLFLRLGSACPHLCQPAVSGLTTG